MTARHGRRHRPDGRHALGVPACPCWDCRVARAADRALNRGEVVEVEDLVLVPDVVAIEAEANGLDVPDTWSLVRDGRRVHVYAVPEGQPS